jgi:hypothetical protein
VSKEEDIYMGGTLQFTRVMGDVILCAELFVYVPEALAPGCPALAARPEASPHPYDIYERLAPTFP